MKKQSAVGILKTKDGILLLKRFPYDRTLPDVLCLPGGKIEKGEKTIDGIIREFKEETNLEINVIQYLTTQSNAKFDIHFYLVELSNGCTIDMFKKSNEHESYGFFKIGDLVNHKVGEVTLKVLNDISWIL